MHLRMDEDTALTPFEIVRNLIVEQKWAVDDRNAAALVDFYARDVVLSVSVNGGEPIAVKGCEAVMAMTVSTWDKNRETAAHIHFLATPSLRFVDDGKIAAEYYCLYLSNDPSALGMVGHGRYHDLFVFEDGAWRIFERRLRTTGDVKANDLRNASASLGRQ